MLVDAPQGNAVGAGWNAQWRAARMAECEAERVRLLGAARALA